MPDPIADTLGTVPLLAGLDQQQRERLAQTFRERASRPARS